MGRGNPSPGKGLRGTPGATFMASLLACYTRNRRPSAPSPTSGREDKKRLVYMVPFKTAKKTLKAGYS